MRILSILSLIALASLACGGAGERGTTTTSAKPAKVEAKATAQASTELVCEPTLSKQVDGCSMGSVTCGGTIDGSNKGGQKRYDDTFYQRSFCTPQRNEYDAAGEAVFTLEVPADIKAEVSLESPCGDLDLAALSWKDTTTCPVQGSMLPECEMETKKGDGALVITTVDKPQTYLLVVDGKDGDEGNFRIHVKCSTYR